MRRDSAALCELALALAVCAVGAEAGSVTEDARNFIIQTHSDHPQGLHEALEASATLRSDYIQAHLELADVSLYVPGGDPERTTVYDFCRDLVSDALGVPGQLYFEKTRVYDPTATPRMTLLREKLYRTWRDALPLTPERKDEIATVGNFSSQQAAILQDHDVLIMDNAGLDSAQLGALDTLLRLIPASLHDTAAIGVEKFLGVEEESGGSYPPDFSREVFFAGKEGGINIYGTRIHEQWENQFPDDVPPGEVPIFCSCAAHEVNHRVDTLTIDGSPVLSARRAELIQAAGSNPMNYLRSMCEEGLFVDHPGEFFPSIANQWFADSAKTIELGVVRFQAGGHEPINQALFFAEVYSQGTNVTLFYFCDIWGNLHRREVALTRDAFGHIKSLEIGPRRYEFVLDAEGNVQDIVPSIIPPTPVVYVSKSASGPTHDGKSWATAFLTVQEGVNAALPGEEVWVAAGTYEERIGLRGGVAAYAGFAGGETSRDQRNWATHVAVLDGGGTGSVVVPPEGATDTTRIDGFTIRNGSARTGGGVDCYLSSPTIANNRIVGNSAEWGGGICCQFSSPEIRNNVIVGNAASVEGGGICCHTSSPTITNNTVADNTGTNNGGGATFAYDSSPSVRNCVLWSNAAPAGSQIALTAPTGPGPTLTIDYCCVQGGVADVYRWAGWGLNWGDDNIDTDPLFAAPGHWDGGNWLDGDYHLQSAAGRHDPAPDTWVADFANSPCIDAGDPLSPVGDEPEVHGGIVNQGACGGTAWASRTYPSIPGPVAFDTRITVNGGFNQTGPGSRSVTIASIDQRGNAEGVRYAIRMGTGPGGRWLALAGGVARATAEDPDLHLASDWAGARVCGLDPATPYTFCVVARDPIGRQTSDGPPADFATNNDCDVDRSHFVNALDYALIKAGCVRGGSMGNGLPWPGDVDGDEDVDTDDLNAIMDRALTP